MNDLISDLKNLYEDLSKHSNYQNIPAFVTKALGYQEKIDEGWRGDSPRLNYIKRFVQIRKNESWGDFGANTGFFTLSLANQFPSTQFTAIEANKMHSEFISKIASHFRLDNVTSVHKSIEFDNLLELGSLDVLMHLNVLHHAGHDFDRQYVTGPLDFADYAQAYLKRLRSHTKALIFQMGSNLGGNKRLPLVEYNNDKAKLALFSTYLLNAGWSICDVAYPTNDSGQIVYQSLPDDLLRVVTIGGGITENPDISTWFSELNLNQFPGEFYRRPIFICSGV